MDEALRQQVDEDKAMTPERGQWPHPAKILAADIAGDHCTTDSVPVWTCMSVTFPAVKEPFLRHFDVQQSAMVICPSRKDIVV